MPFWRRGGSDRDAVSAPAIEAVDGAGASPCALPGCARGGAVDCAYVDRRGRGCGTAWCAEHRHQAGGRAYCRRHVGVVTALAAHGEGIPVPDIDNRAPALVEWVARDVAAPVEAMLGRIAAGGPGSRLVTDPLRLVFVGRERERMWQRSWKVVDHTGVVFDVELGVREERDTEVELHVDGLLRAELTPPWIDQRMRGETPTPEEDARRRAAFRAAIVDAVSAGAAEMPVR